MRRFRFFALGAALAAACAPLPPGAAPAAGSSGYAEDRVQVGSFAVIDAVAVSRRFVYVAASGGVVVFDRVAERWLPPHTRDLDRELGRDAAFKPAGLSGVPTITVMAGDPSEEAVWIGVPGAVLVYRPFTGQVQRTVVLGVPQRIVFERAGAGGGDALVASGGQWTRISRVGIATALTGAPHPSQVFVPPALSELVERYPTLRAQPQLLLRAERPNRPRRPFALTAGAASPDRTSELWLGTNGEGLFRVDPIFGQGAAMPFGLLEPGAGALAPAANGVWVAGLGQLGTRGGLTFATADLQRWRWIEGTLAGARAFALATRGNRAWLATDRGLVRIALDDALDDAPDGARAITAWTRLAGLPDDRVFAVAPRDEGSWAGTARGLVFVHADDQPVVAAGDLPPVVRSGPGPVRLDGVAVFALQQTGTSLWAGTASGLVHLAADPVADGAVRTVAGAGIDPGLRRGVRALAASDSILLVATDEAVFRLPARRGPEAGVDAERIVALEPRWVGEVTRLAADDRAIALAGRDGVVLLARGSGAVRTLRTPSDLPGPALDVLLQRDWLFVATPQGLVRYRRSGDGLVP